MGVLAPDTGKGMQSNLEPYWTAARGHEVNGELPAARTAYEAILRIDPTQAFAWYRLSALALMQGRYRDAHAAATEGTTVAIAHHRWKALPYLTQQMLGFDEREAVRGAIEAADWSDQAVLAQSAVLAQQLWLADAHAVALRLADHALGVVPRSHLLHYVRANVLRHLGRMDEATQAFEQCLALAPQFAEAHWALAYHAKADPPGARIQRIRAALAAVPADDPMRRIYLGYALFKELDDAGDTEAAWSALDAAAGLMRRQGRYDSGREQETVLTLREAFDSPQPTPTSSSDHRTPVFIVGMPRTGTTVLERILGNHSRFASAGELNTFSSCMGLAIGHDFAIPPVAELVRAAAAVDPVAVGAMYLQRTAAYYGDRTHLIDKNPLNIFNAGFIARALPQAKILCLLRNPMDACFSNLKELFPGGGYGYSYGLEDLAGHWLRFRDLVAHWQQVLPGRFQVIGYEDLVAEPLRISTEVMEFCGVSVEPECVDITRNSAPVSTASSSQVRNPIHTGGIDAWRRYERQLSPLLARLQRDIPELR